MCEQIFFVVKHSTNSKTVRWWRRAEASRFDSPARADLVWPSAFFFWVCALECDAFLLFTHLVIFHLFSLIFPFPVVKSIFVHQRWFFSKFFFIHIIFLTLIGDWLNSVVGFCETKIDLMARIWCLIQNENLFIWIWMSFSYQFLILLWMTLGLLNNFRLNSFSNLKLCFLNRLINDRLVALSMLTNWQFFSCPNCFWNYNFRHRYALIFKTRLVDACPCIHFALWSLLKLCIQPQLVYIFFFRFSFFY